MATKTVRTEPVRFQAACAIESDYVFIAAKPESLDEDQAFTRIFYFDQQNATPWRHVDIPDFTVAGVCVVLKPNACMPKLLPAIPVSGASSVTSKRMAFGSRP